MKKRPLEVLLLGETVEQQLPCHVSVISQSHPPLRKVDRLLLAFEAPHEKQRESAFQSLMAHVHACQCCPRMQGRSRVLGPENGDLRARVLFVAEAPGRLGADKWQIPLFGDQTGRHFELLLEEAGLKRREIFVTNAVLCNPRDARGLNASPTRQEIANCSEHLRDTLAFLQPANVVTLGHVALKALSLLAPHTLQLARDVGKPCSWQERWLIPLYHPSPRACLHRPLALQKEDYRHLGAFIRTSVSHCPGEEP